MSVPLAGASLGDAPPIGPIVRIPRQELIATHLRRRIVRGEIAVGDTLPPEVELMAQFGVSRSTLRETFRILETELLISVWRGSRGGAQVTSPELSVAARTVGRNFAPLAPNRLWVADFTYVSTLAGWVYVAFVIAYARRILGWKVSTSMTTDRVLAAINQAIFTQSREGVRF